jgi:hypothetical protein
MEDTSTLTQKESGATGHQVRVHDDVFEMVRVAAFHKRTTVGRLVNKLLREVLKPSRHN